jgi:hypothetical protein
VWGAVLTGAGVTAAAAEASLHVGCCFASALLTLQQRSRRKYMSVKRAVGALNGYNCCSWMFNNKEHNSQCPCRIDSENTQQPKTISESTGDSDSNSHCSEGASVDQRFR